MPKLEPPLAQYIYGPNATHSSRRGLPRLLGAFNEDQINELLLEGNYIDDTGRPTHVAIKNGLIDLCEGKILWRGVKVAESFERLAVTRQRQRELKEDKPAPPPTPEESDEPHWVDLETIGTWFGVSKIQVGKWLDQLGLREEPQIQVNESGDLDMLDVARASQGRNYKQPTEKALSMGVATMITVQKGDKFIEFPKWNLELTKAVFAAAGHEIDHERKGALKGKGKNGDIQVSGIEQRATELYVKWARLYNDPKTRWQCAKLFRGQPEIILKHVEAKMGMPGYLTEGRYLKHK